MKSSALARLPSARLAAVLVLLFGQRVSHLATLTTDTVSVDDDGWVSLALSDTPVRLREPLAELARHVADAARAAGRPDRVVAVRRRQLGQRQPASPEPTTSASAIREEPAP